MQLAQLLDVAVSVSLVDLHGLQTHGAVLDAAAAADAGVDLRGLCSCFAQHDKAGSGLGGGVAQVTHSGTHHSAAGHDLAQSDAALEAGSVQDILVGSTHGDDEVLGLLAGIAVHGDDAADHRHTGSQILAEAGHTGHVHDDGAGSGGQAAVRDLAAHESVSEGHPDKVADQISDAVLDKLLAFDPSSKVACETLVTTGQVVLAGEVKTKAYVDLQRIAREVINRIGYTKSEYMFEGNSCGVFSAIHEQSADINRGVEREDPMNQGAGDQGMMFGYATNETENYMPLSLDLAHKLLMVLAEIRREGKVMTYLRPDAKSQVTIEYDDNGKPVRIDTIVVSTQHDEFVTPADSSKEAQLKADEEMLAKIRQDVIEILMPRVIAEIHNEEVLALFNDQIVYHVNPTGKFVIGGPHGDTGLTGRKIIVDTYGGKGAHGGGAFSGKDPSKVDRSAAYAARHIAKNMVAAGVADEMLVQVSYAIGVARPINIYVNTYGRSNVKLSDGEIAKKIDQLFDLRPKAIEERLKLRNPIYEETASYGHMGREPKVVTKTYESMYHEAKTLEVELFTWEKLDYVNKIKEAFGL